MIEKSGDNVLPAVLGHYVVKTRISTVGHAAALVKALNDAGLDLAQHADVLREIGDVACLLRIGEEFGDCFRKDEVIVLDFDDFSGSHGAEPFANVAFVKARGSGKLLAPSRGQRCEEPRRDRCDVRWKSSGTTRHG